MLQRGNHRGSNVHWFERGCFGLSSSRWRTNRQKLQNGRYILCYCRLVIELYTFLPLRFGNLVIQADNVYKFLENRSLIKNLLKENRHISENLSDNWKSDGDVWAFYRDLFCVCVFYMFPVGFSVYRYHCFGGIMRIFRYFLNYASFGLRSEVNTPKLVFVYNLRCLQKDSLRPSNKQKFYRTCWRKFLSAVYVRM